MPAVQPTVRPTVRIALSNVLLATDFSEISKAALPFARHLAQWYEGKVFVTHVVPAYQPYLSVPLEPVPVDLDLFWKREQESLTAFAGEGFGDTPHEEILQRGDLWDTLSDVIRRKNIDVVVAGTHGLRGLRKVLLGSVAERIYRHAACPVLTIGPGVANCSGANWQLKKIVFATDFSVTSLHALPYALSLAEENEATLVFLHVVPPTVQDREYAKRHAQEELEKIMPADPWYRPEFVVGSGIPRHEILRVAREQRADLIVMGVKTMAGMPDTLRLPWSTAVEVMSGAPCPVLTVR